MLCVTFVGCLVQLCKGSCKCSGYASPPREERFRNPFKLVAFYGPLHVRSDCRQYLWTCEKHRVPHVGHSAVHCAIAAMRRTVRATRLGEVAFTQQKRATASLQDPKVACSCTLAYQELSPRRQVL